MASDFFWLSLFCVFYVYGGYPILLMGIALFFPKSKHNNTAVPSITIVIPAYNEEQVIERKFENCFSLDYPKEKLQILVVADGSVDQTADIAGQYLDKGVKLLYNTERRGKMAAINHAIPHITSEIVVFSDANNIYRVDALRKLVAPFYDKSVGAVSGAKTIIKGDGPLGESEGLYWKYESSIKRQESRIGSCISLVGEIFALRKSLLAPCPEHIINDDSYMASRLLVQGHRIVYADTARSVERISASAREELKRRSRIIAGRYQIISMFPKLFPWKRPIVAWMLISHKYLRPFVALAMVVALVTNIVLVLWPPENSKNLLFDLAYPFNWLFLFFQAVFYAMAVAGNYAKKIRGVGKVLYLPKFLVFSNIAALIGLFRFLRGSQTPIWERAQRRDIP